jgi:hypothetical protein
MSDYRLNSAAGYDLMMTPDTRFRIEDFLITGSLMDSWYRAGDNRRYNTYYNTRYISNIIAGKDFPVGRSKRNSIGINSRFILRGGYRYTPVNKWPHYFK